MSKKRRSASRSSSASSASSSQQASSSSQASSAQATASRHERSRTQRPSAMIWPVSSATGMKSAGDTQPRLGWRQRLRPRARRGARRGRGAGGRQGAGGSGGGRRGRWGGKSRGCLVPSARCPGGAARDNRSRPRPTLPRRRRPHCSYMRHMWEWLPRKKE